MSPRRPAKRRSVLAAVDFSPPSLLAAEAAARLARDLGVGLVLLHATAPAVVPKAGRSPTKRTRAKRLSGASALSELALRLGSQGLDVEAVEATGHAATVAIQEAAARGSVALVAATTGKGQLRSLLVGSTARDLLQASTVPLLLVPARAAPKGTLTDPPLILVAMDFSADAQRAYEAALALAKDLRAKVRLLHVVPTPLPMTGFPGAEFTTYPIEVLDRDEREAASRLARLASAARKSKVGVQPSVQVGHPASVILAEARQAGAGLIVLGTHGSSRARRFFLGSVAQMVVQMADRPVLVIPRPDGPPAGAWGR